MTDRHASLASAIAERYRLEREVGAGGMATVYLAHDIRHNRKVAIKVLHAELAAVVGGERFLAEIETTANLQHPHILPLHDSGAKDGFLYYVMPFVEGESLRRRLDREKQLPIEEGLAIARDVADALGYAHGRGVIHRDIKPDNILLASGHAIVADFGIARAVTPAGRSRLTATGLALGTPAYMSPEQATGSDEVDGRSDIYALGCVLYEMLAGQAPFTGPTVESVVFQHLGSTPRQLGELRPGVPTHVAAIAARALAKTPADRFQTGADFARALSEPAVAPPAGIAATGASGRDSSARRWGIGVGVLALIAIALGLSGVLRWGNQSSPGTTREGSALETIEPKRVVAVLPFENLSPDPRQGYFSAGVTEEIAGELSQLSALRLISRGAVAPYAEAPDRMRRLAAELGVGSVVEGTVRLAGTRVRISVQLSDTRTGATLWSEGYDRDMQDVLGVQEEVARRIAAALEAALTPDEVRRVGRRATADAEAYRLYLRSRELQSSNVPQNLAAIDLLQQALRRDSTFADAWAAVARRQLFRGLLERPAYLDTAAVSIARALTLAPDMPTAHFTRGTLLGVHGDLDGSRLAFLRALELDHNHAGAMADLSVLEMIRGHLDESLYWALRGMSVAPNLVDSYFHVSLPLLALGELDVADRWLAQAREAFPGEVRIEGRTALLELLRGRDAAALDRLRRLVSANPGAREAAQLLADVAVVAGAPDAEALVAGVADATRDAGDGMTFLSESYRALHGLVLWQRGVRPRAAVLWDEASAAAEREIAAGHQGADRRVELAAIAATRGDTARALQWLERAYDAGWRQPLTIARDPFFDGLRGHPGFRRIVERAAGDVSVMRARAEATHGPMLRSPPKRPDGR